MIRWPSPDALYKRSFVAIVLANVLVQAASLSVRAEVKINGSADSMEVEVNNASLDEFLAALRSSFGLKYQSSAPLTARFSDKYSGTLEYVVWQALYLKDYNWLFKTTDGRPTLQIFDALGKSSNDTALVDRTPIRGQPPPPAHQPQQLTNSAPSPQTNVAPRHPPYTRQQRFRAF
jgi:hypothetical protein